MIMTILPILPHRPKIDRDKNITESHIESVNNIHSLHTDIDASLPRLTIHIYIYRYIYIYIYI